MPMTDPPLRLRFPDAEKRLIAIDWRDGHVSEFPTAYLRGWCPCAECQGHRARHEFRPGGEDRVASFQQVGAYAVQIHWADGHHAGIWSWQRLRETCPCRSCGGPLEGTPDEVASLVPEQAP